MRTTRIALLVAPLCVPGVACAQPYFAEVFMNPPGPDQGYESMEIMGEKGSPMAGYWIVVIDGNGHDAGIVTHLIDLDETSIGSNGLMVIRDDALVATLPTPDPASSLLEYDFEPDLGNGTTTFVLVSGAPWFGPLFDLDYDNDGTIDAPLSLTIHDAVSISDGGSSDREYARQLGGAQLGTHVGATQTYTPDALYRILTASGEIHAWAGGDAHGPIGGPWNWVEQQTFGFGSACIETVGPLTIDLGAENLRFMPYADCDGSTGPGVLDIFDFLCFADSFIRGDSYACECDTSSGPDRCDVFDFLCFQRLHDGMPLRRSRRLMIRALDWAAWPGETR